MNVMNSLLLLALLATPALAENPAESIDDAFSQVATDALQTVAELPTVPAGLNSKHALAIQPAKTISATYRLTVNAPQLTAQRWLVFAAKPTNHAGQSIRRVETTPSSRTIADLSRRGQPLLLSRVPVKSKLWKHRLEYSLKLEAELFSRRLVTSKTSQPASEVPALSSAQRVMWLVPSDEFDYRSAEFQRWLKQQRLTRAEREGEVDFAQRVFLAIARNFKYEYLGDQDRRASQVCSAGKSDCGGLSGVFVSALRSQGIPARTLVGRWALSAKPGETLNEINYFQEHVKAEFFAQGVGWTPVDLSSAILHDRSREKLRYFGQDPGDFVTFHFDTDLTFDTYYFGKKTMTLMQKPSYWATGSGSFDEVTFDEAWQVRPGPIRAGGSNDKE